MHLIYGMVHAGRVRLEDQFKRFIEEKCRERKPALLGLSGGADSLALFYLLIGEQYPFEVAHIDHGWREESSDEAAYLAELCASKKIPFHLKKLTPPHEQKNLEDDARKQRLQFFKQVINQRELKWVFLAHHADDQAETVLKRVFEGASLPKLRGLQQISTVENLALIRPLLDVKKQTIKEWLEKKKIPYFTDPTNQNTYFLRSRLREEIIPALSANFGKEIGQNLCRLGETAAELGDFIEGLIVPLKRSIECNEEGTLFDFSRLLQNSPFLWKCLIREICASNGLTLNHALLKDIELHLQKGSANKKWIVGGKNLLVHRKTLTIEEPAPHSL